jgi:molybdopterin converting factor small subunit
MDKNKPRIDMVNEILEECILAYPVSSFVISLYKQYLQRGSLSKRQLQGLYGKAQKIEGLAPAKLATLEALINKMPTRYKSELPPTKPLYEKQDTNGELIEAILAKYPQHKRVLFLKSKYDNNEMLSPSEVADLKRFHQLLK